MKRSIILTVIFFAFFYTSINGGTFYNRTINADVFFGALEPYGEWIEIGYDDYVWRPYKSDYNWRPYSIGRWEWTRHGWYWVSYEPFGWATFHYGRWYFDDYYGWVWMPDEVWGPSWVEWRYDNYYIGWAPLPPYAVFNPGRGIYFSIKWNSGHFYWNFVKYNHFISHEIHNHFIDRHYTERVYKRSKYRTNYFEDNNRIVNGGISRRYVEGKIGRKFQTREITRTEDLSENNTRNLRSSRGIVEFTPSEKMIRNKNFDKRNIKKGRELKSLKTDRVVINKRNSERIIDERNKTGNIRTPEAEREKNLNNGSKEKSEIRKNGRSGDVEAPRKINLKKRIENRDDIVRNDDIKKKSAQKSDNRREYTTPKTEYGKSGGNKKSESVSNKKSFDVKPEKKLNSRNSFERKQKDVSSNSKVKSEKKSGRKKSDNKERNSKKERGR